MRFKKLTLVLIFSFFYFSTFAQQLEVGISAGGASYLGDLNQYDPLKISGLSAGAYLKLNFNSFLGLGFHYNYGKIKATDANSSNEQFRDRNLNFYTPLNEVSLLLAVNLFDLYSYGPKRRFTPYIFAGIGAVIFEPKTKYNDQEFLLRNYSTEGQSKIYKGYTITIPYGVGGRYKIKDSWTIFSQIGYRSPLTDYLDDVSGVYPTASQLDNSLSPGLSRALSDRSGEETGIYLGDPGTQRGDFRKRDNYMFVGIGISYTFVSQKCYTF
jgi:opacity protein-like surface antigen